MKSLLFAFPFRKLLCISFFTVAGVSSFRSVWLVFVPLKRFLRGISAGKLVAMTVTLISPFFNFSSRIVPKITFASLSIDSVIIFAASWISLIVKSSPPEIAKSTPLAP